MRKKKRQRFHFLPKDKQYISVVYIALVFWALTLEQVKVKECLYCDNDMNDLPFWSHWLTSRTFLATCRTRFEPFLTTAAFSHSVTDICRRWPAKKNRTWIRFMSIWYIEDITDVQSFSTSALNRPPPLQHNLWTCTIEQKLVFAILL